MRRYTAEFVLEIEAQNQKEAHRLLKQFRAAMKAIHPEVQFWPGEDLFPGSDIIKAPASDSDADAVADALESLSDRPVSLEGFLVAS